MPPVAQCHAVAITPPAPAQPQCLSASVPQCLGASVARCHSERNLNFHHWQLEVVNFLGLRWYSCHTGSEPLVPALLLVVQLPAVQCSAALNPQLRSESRTLAAAAGDSDLKLSLVHRGAYSAIRWRTCPTPSCACAIGGVTSPWRRQRWLRQPQAKVPHWQARRVAC